MFHFPSYTSYGVTYLKIFIFLYKGDDYIKGNQLVFWRMVKADHQEQIKLKIHEN